MESKMDITISRTVTINTGNYMSIKPSVSLTLKDVRVEDTKSAHENLSDMVDSLLAMETIKIGEEMRSVKSMGWEPYMDALNGSSEEIVRSLDKAVKGVLEI